MDEDNYTFTYQTKLPLSQPEAFEWHKKDAMFERLMPPFMNTTLLSKNPQLKLNDIVHCKLNLFGDIGVDSFFKITDYKEGEYFVDEQIKGPFSFWKHRHEFQAIDEANSLLNDSVTFRAPLESFLGTYINSKIAKRLSCLFKYRETTLKNDILFCQEMPQEKMHILMTGSNGLIGSALTTLLRLMGHIVTPITRHLKAGEKGIFWDIENQKINPEDLENYDALIHLAGENIAGLWSEQKKDKIYNSRIHSTKLLVNTMNMLEKPPKIFICASGINYYKENHASDETSSMGSGFLACVVKDNENEALKYQKGRVSLVRTGVVLSSRGGMLKKLLHSFQLGLGTKLGTGKQHLSWIAIDDLIYQYVHILMNSDLQGPINAVSPNSVTNEEFSKTLAKKLNRPCFLSLPKGFVNTVFGEMGKETMLADLMVEPKKLLEAQSKFFFSDLGHALEHLLGA